MAEVQGLSGGPGFRAQATALKPAITRRMLLFFMVGDILGGGIYALVGEVGAESRCTERGQLRHRRRWLSVSWTWAV